ncbi:hypothetical protein BX616_006779 [Lobosporangium transversale]|nr:hypothetical protein BX616_006779 [Lobosporangium transversale]
MIIAPVWEQLAVTHQALEKIKDFKFAEVNCLMEGDICDDNGVTSYPTLALFHDRERVQTYSGRRTIEDLSEFVRVQAEAYSNKANQGGYSGANPNGQVVALDGKNYESSLKDGQPWLIEYYAPWCGHCKALAPIYEEVAKALKGKINVGKVDCPANEVICRSQKVRGYPTIKLHQHGQATEFNKKRTLESMTEFALGATQPSVKVITLSDLQEIKERADVAFIYLSDEKTSKDITTVIEKQSQIFYEQITIYSTSDPLIARQLSITTVPALLVLKDERQYQYPGLLSDAGAVQSWIEQAKAPLVPLVTNSNTAVVLNAPGWVVLGLFDPAKASTTAARRALIETAHTYRKGLAGGTRSLIDGRPIRFAFLDATKWTNYIKNALGVELLNLPVIVAVNSLNEVFYPHASDGRRVAIEEEALLQYVSDIELGVLQEQSMLSYGQKVLRHVSSNIHSVFSFVGNHPYATVILGSALLYGLVRKLNAEPDSRAEILAKAD